MAEWYLRVIYCRGLHNLPNYSTCLHKQGLIGLTEDLGVGCKMRCSIDGGGGEQGQGKKGIKLNTMQENIHFKYNAMFYSRQNQT